MSNNINDTELLEQLVDAKNNFFLEIGKIVIGQKGILDQMLIALLTKGHTLLVGVPGLAKTLLIKSMAEICDLNFKRIQFTPDLMPSDITGTELIDIDPETEQRNFRFYKGPIFGNIILADEINRTPPKTQAALLEAMQEHRVTAGGHSYKLDEPFFVLATQNPIEQEGTYPLPEAQMDRFMLKCVITYPEFDDEQQIIRSNINESFEKVKPVISIKDILKAQETVKEVYMDEKIEKYILNLIFATRYPEKNNLSDLKPLIGFGSSPRGSINLASAAKCHAFIQRRGYVIPEDIRAVINDVLRHRIGLTYEAEAENVTSEDIISKIVNTVEVP